MSAHTYCRFAPGPEFHIATGEFRDVPGGRRVRLMACGAEALVGRLWLRLERPPRVCSACRDVVRREGRE